jgi:hypothetical protein
LLKHVVRGKQTKYPRERIRIRADSLREIRRGSRLAIQCIGDSQVGHNMKASRQAVASGHLKDR